MTLETSPSQSLRGSRGPLNNFLVFSLKFLNSTMYMYGASYICAEYIYMYIDGMYIYSVKRCTIAPDKCRALIMRIYCIFIIFAFFFYLAFSRA